jgi:glucose-1-phosphate cytidylyltransferase
LGDINIDKLLKFHKTNKRYATLTSIHPFGRFGNLGISEKGEVLSFQEKPQENRAWINGGFFVLEPQVFDYIKGDETVFEQEPLENLSRDRQLLAFQHRSFWMCMDTLRDKNELERLYASGNPPWIMRRD